MGWNLGWDGIWDGMGFGMVILGKGFPYRPLSINIELKNV